MLKFYNTLTRRKEVFEPLVKGKVSMYNCGPTVYNYAHIGNFRAYICSDLLRRYLEYSNYKVKQVMNITDVDDKTIRDSQKEKKSLKDFTEFYTKAFFDDIETLNILKAHVFPKATDHIKEMLDLINKLKVKGITYEKDGSTYYSIKKFKDYGKLAKIKLDQLRPGARVNQDEYEKEEAHDFSLWKGYTEEDGDVFWETQIGKGRPGWHIECSAMSMKHLGPRFDIHTGGIDLIFPHHTNEIAQSEACTGKKFVNYWLHNEYMLVNGQKMSKSLNNFYTLRDILDKGYKPKAIRYLLMSTHYRQKLNFTFEGLDGAQSAIERISDFMLKLKTYKGENDNRTTSKLLDKAKKDFEQQMNDDLNISSALGQIFDLVREINKLMQDKEISTKDAKTVIEQMEKFDEVLGVLYVEDEVLDEDIDKLIQDREQARKDKDYTKADKIRDKLSMLHIILEDTPDGVRWKKR